MSRFPPRTGPGARAPAGSARDPYSQQPPPQSQQSNNNNNADVYGGYGSGSSGSTYGGYGAVPGRGSGGGSGAGAYAAAYDALNDDDGYGGGDSNSYSGGGGGGSSGGGLGGVSNGYGQGQASRYTSAVAASSVPTAAATARSRAAQSNPSATSSSSSTYSSSSRSGVGVGAGTARARVPISSSTSSSVSAGAGHGYGTSAVTARSSAATARSGSASGSGAGAGTGTGASRSTYGSSSRSIANRPAWDDGSTSTSTSISGSGSGSGFIPSGNAAVISRCRGGGGHPGDSSSGQTSSAGGLASFTSSDRSRWARGPGVTRVCVPGHARPVFGLALSPRNGFAVTASADHGLRVFDLRTGRMQRELFTKTAGHKEWVTTVDVVHHSGRVLSGGMDFVGCVWEPNSTKCGFLGPFDGPVTKVSADDGWRALTSSMDGTIKLWDIRSSFAPRELCSYGSHGKGVTTFRWDGTRVVSAERGGALHLWDIETAQPLTVLTGHPGAVVTSIQFLTSVSGDGDDTAASGSAFCANPAPHMIVSGGTDGYFRVYDTRSDRAVSQRRVSAGRQGAGAVADIATWGWGAGAAEARPDVVDSELAHAGAYNNSNSKSASGDGDNAYGNDGDDGDEANAANDAANGAGHFSEDYSRRGPAHAEGSTYLSGAGGAGVARAPGDHLVALALTDGAVALVDPRRGWATSLSLLGPRAPAMAVRFAPGGRHVLATTADGACYGWDCRERVPVRAVVTGAVEAVSPIPRRGPGWGMCVSAGPEGCDDGGEAAAVVRGGSGGRAVSCLEVWVGGAVCAGEDGKPLILDMNA